MKREDIFKYVQKKYNTRPEYEWDKYPSYAVLRHSENNKWYGLIMNVPNDKLGLDGDGGSDVLNVKADPDQVGSLQLSPDILPAYHMNKEHWISVLLDSHLQKDEIFTLLDESYRLTN